jgi:hypothetical protein
MTRRRDDMNDYAKIDSYLEANLDKSLAELARLVAQPSTSAPLMAGWW